MPLLTLPSVVGHRGAASYSPENTLASLTEAKTRGATWVEFDVKLSGDGVPVLMHDASLKRTAGLDRAAAATSWAEIATLDAGGWFAPRFAGERVPSFEQTIRHLAVLGLGANVEIKPCPGREAETAIATVRMLQRLWPAALPTPVLSSFADSALAAARDTAPELSRALLFGATGDDWAARASAVGAVGINVAARRLTPERAADIRAAGYLLSVYTVNEPEAARRLMVMGAHSIISDAPDLVIAALAR